MESNHALRACTRCKLRALRALRGCCVPGGAWGGLDCGAWLRRELVIAKKVAHLRCSCYMRRRRRYKCGSGAARAASVLLRGRRL
jgi:hypothetical protein